MDIALKAAQTLKAKQERASENLLVAEANERTALNLTENAQIKKRDAITEASLQNGIEANLKADAQDKARLASVSIAEVNIAKAEAEKAVFKVAESQANAEKAVFKVAEKIAEAESSNAEAKKSAELARLATQAADDFNERVSAATAAADAAADEYRQIQQACHLARDTLESLEAKISSIVGILSGKTFPLFFRFNL